MRKALLISYRFPPQGGGGVQRTLKYAKYLRDFGWEPVIHTARDPFWPVWDESLLREIPEGVHVYRTRTFEFERLEHRLARRGRAAPGATNGTAPARAARPPAEPGAGSRSPRRHGALGRLRAAVHRRLLIPDPQIAWLPGAFVQGLRIARRERPQVIYTSSPPNSVQLLGGLLARALGRPWVADFRDPWTDGPRRQQAYVGNRTRERIERAAERWVVRNADRIVVSAAPLRERFLQKYPFLSPDTVETLTNGFDPADFGEGDGSRLLEPGRFHVTGTGNIEAMFDRRPLFRAIAELIEEDPDIRRDLLVTLVGAKRSKQDDVLAALGLSDRVRYPGWVAHAQSIRYLQESDVLLMCQLPHAGGGAEKLSGKCFEYLYLRKPVLCLSVPGLTADLLAETGLGTVVDPADTAGIKAALHALYARRHGPDRGDPAVVARFDRRRLTERLAALFDEVATARPLARRAAPAGVR
jgi:glycosyltransferase involved in cell wall biosynthesis